ncbi:MAG TPA: hypothetical protein VEB00_07165 [Clostridia bacterium]|nr:hypothetical protein [Clostridia bacterium]
MNIDKKGEKLSLSTLNWIISNVSKVTALALYIDSHNISFGQN